MGIATHTGPVAPWTVRELPLEIRDVPPFEGAVRHNGVRLDGRMDGVHTGGVWFVGDLVYKPLDGRPYMNALCHVPTREAEVLALMAGEPGFPPNWRVEQRNARWFLVRQRAQIFPHDLPYGALTEAQALAIERGVIALNQRGWSLNETVCIGLDADGELFIVDLSIAMPDREADDGWRVERWFEEAGFGHLARLRQNGRHVVCTAAWQLAHGRAWARPHVYASRKRPASPVWCRLPEAFFVPADYASTAVHTWVVTRAPLPHEITTSYELQWAWSPCAR